MVWTGEVSCVKMSRVVLAREWGDRVVGVGVGVLMMRL